MSKLLSACPGFEEDLSALLDGELEAARDARVRAHVSGCARCGERLAQLERVEAGLRTLSVHPVSEAVLQRVRGRLAEELPRFGRAAPRRPRRRLRRLALPAGLVAAAAALALALLWAPRWSRHPAVQTQPAELPLEVALEQSSDEELELAMGLDALGGLAADDDLALIEQLDLLEQLDALDAG